MLDFFYRGSQHAIQASKPEMLQHANEINEIIATIKADIELVAVNKFYKWTFIGRAHSGYGEGRLHVYLVRGDHKTIRREHEFNGLGGDVWDRAPNYVQLRELEFGQMEMF